MHDLKRPLPPDRTYEEVRNHYEVEREIADRLRETTSIEERRPILATMYDELFERVPDHPRLRRREEADHVRTRNRRKLRMVRRFIDDGTRFVEFAPGDCRFAFEMCAHVGSVVGVDISDQSGDIDSVPDNFRMVIYDGVDLDLPDESVDVMFSDQFIEHIHPDDAELHFRIAHRILRKGGVYILRTPHRFMGPSDVSKYFCDEPMGFHLKEWTYTELGDVILRAGFSSWRGLRRRPALGLRLAERLIGRFAPARRRALGKRYLKDLIVSAHK